MAGHIVAGHGRSDDQGRLRANRGGGRRPQRWRGGGGLPESSSSATMIAGGTCRLVVEDLQRITWLGGAALVGGERR